MIFICHFTGAFAQLLPIPDWVKDIGGTGESKTSGVAVDQYDNVYVSGNFQGTLTFNPGTSPITLTSKGSYDVFVAKYTYDGQLLWATRFGGTNLDQANALAVDLNGNAYIPCMTMSSGIDSAPRQGVFNFSGSGQDGLLVKIDKDGEFEWARKIGGSNDDAGHMATTDNEGNVIIAGKFSSSNVVLDSWTISSNGNYDGFMVKYAPNGNVIWAYAIGSGQDDEIFGVKTTSTNEVAIMGYITTSANLNPKGPAVILNTNKQIFYLAKYSKDGDLIWSNTIDGTNNRCGTIAVNGSDDIYVNGAYTGNVTFNSIVPGNSLTLNNNTGLDLYLTKYKTNGELTWARRMKGTGNASLSYHIAADIDDNVYISGYFNGTLQFGDAPNSTSLTYHGMQDTFFGKYDAAGNFIWAFNFGSACIGNFGHKIAVDSKKNVLLGGRFCQTIDFNPGNCELNLTAQHSVSDGFIAKYNQVKLTGEPIVTSFTLAQQTRDAQIDVQNKTINIFVHPGTDLTRLKPNIRVDIGLTNPLSDTEQDFTNPKIYTVSSNCLDYNWTVKVNLATNQQTEICAAIPFLVYGEMNSVPNPSFQWEIEDSNQNWINAPQASDLPDYESPGISNYTDADQVFKFRRRVTSNGIDSYDSEVHITIHPSTIKNTISTSQPLNCDGKANITINGTTPEGAENSVRTYRWQKSTDEINWIAIPNATDKDLSPPEFNQTIWFRRITLAGNCEAYSNSLKIEVYAQVTTANAGTDIVLCHLSSPITLNANAVASNETGNWSVISPNGFQPFNAANINNPNAVIQNIPQDQEIQLQWTITSGTCPSSSSTVKIINYSKTSNNTINTVTSNFCTDFAENITIEGTTPLAAFGSPSLYNWDKSTDGNTWQTIPNSDSKDLVIPLLSETTYFRRTAYPNDCADYSNVLKINIYKTPTIANAGQSIQLCDNISFRLNANTFNENEKGAWSVVTPQGYNPFTFSNINNPRASINNIPTNQDVIFKWTITNTVCGTFSSDQVTVNNFKAPAVTLPEKIVIKYGESVNLNASIDSNTPLPYTFEWSPSVGLTDAQTLNPKAHPTESSTYTLKLYYGASCYKFYQVYVLVVKDLELSNAFSPNMDGINDEWVIKNIEGHPKAEVSIYNRYGARLFYSNHYQPWDGTHNGVPVPIGTYYYIIKLNDNKKTMFKGNLTVIR